MVAGLEWRRNLVEDLIATVKPGVFFRVFPDTVHGGFLLWRIASGFSRDQLGWFAVEEDAQEAAEKHLAKRW